MERLATTASDRAPVVGLEAEVSAALAALRASADRPYYDAATDAAARERYYASIDSAVASDALYRALSALVEETHTGRPAYHPMVQVYPWVDLRPDRRLSSIYSGKSFAPEELIRADAEIERRRTEVLQRLVADASALGPREFEAAFDALEAQLPYNCEHVVPQSWFAKREPMRGDLHHLFACEAECNSFRGNTPYFEFADRGDTRADCGRRDGDRFEPVAGKGTLARATLYFLLRYPGLIGDEARELQAERVATLLAWHHARPVDDYERHRNAAITVVQGNRNPLIDQPDWAERIDFHQSFS